MKKFNKKQMKTFLLVAHQWMIFSVLVLVVVMWLLLKDRDEKIQELIICQSNWSQVERQLGSGRIILELKK